MKFQGFPEWFILLRADALVCAKDLAPMFGFKKADSISDHVKQYKDFPAPDTSKKEMRKREFLKLGTNMTERKFPSDTKYWKKSTIVEFVRGLQETQETQVNESNQKL